MDADGQTVERPALEINLAQWVKRLININTPSISFISTTNRAFC